MEFHVSREPFLKALGRLQTVVERRNTMPELGNALLEAREGGLVLSATDLEVSLRTECPAEVEIPGAIAVSARKLFEIVRELPQDDLRLRSESGERLVLTCGRARFTLVGIEADKFPPLPEVDQGQRFDLDGQQLAEMIAKTHFAMSQDETRFTLNGILLHMVSGADAETASGNGVLRMVATDTHRLAMSELALDMPVDESMELIIPRKAVQELRKLMEEDEEPLELGLDEKFIRVTKPGLELSSKLVNGRFPNYQRVIPRENPHRLELEKGELMGVVKRMMVLSHEKSRGIRLQMENDHIKVSTQNPEQEAAEEEMPATFDGKSMSVGFNARYLQEIVSVIEGDNVVFRVRDEESPVLVDEAAGPGYLYVLMPMRV
uniref:Beta sliding clamp n=1 Tax=Magnetococcus massalia (strain MO-1) TaxID=451514 RepID=A0A1S7LLU0_MAGMO|nr:DNA polymerase III subunit beta [Candidatus Magnetococcus massalia]